MGGCRFSTVLTFLPMVTPVNVFRSNYTSSRRTGLVQIYTNKYSLSLIAFRLGSFQTQFSSRHVETVSHSPGLIISECLTSSRSCKSCPGRFKNLQKHCREVHTDNIVVRYPESVGKRASRTDGSFHCDRCRFITINSSTFQVS